MKNTMQGNQILMTCNSNYFSKSRDTLAVFPFFSWTDQNRCIGGCPRFSTCRQGVCVCDHAQCKLTILYHEKTKLLQSCYSNLWEMYFGLFCSLCGRQSKIPKTRPLSATGMVFLYEERWWKRRLPST